MPGVVSHTGPGWSAGSRPLRGSRNMRIVTPILFSILFVGCFYHSARIEVGPSSNAPTELSESEIARATKIVAGIMTEQGFVRAPRSYEIERLSREEGEWTNYVLAVYSAGPNTAMTDRVVVSVLVRKETGRYLVLVRDFDSAAATAFTTSLEQSLMRALSSEFSSRNIRIERQTVGPALGP